MAVNKVIYYGEVLVDMSQVSVNPEKLVEGETALDASGELITGNNPYEKAATDTEVDDQSDLLDQAIRALQGKAAGSGGAVLQDDKEVTPSEEEQIVFPDDGFDGMSQVTVKAIPEEYIVPNGEIEITENGTYDVTGYASAAVNVAQSGGSGGSDDMAGKLASRTITEFASNGCTAIGEYAFRGCSSLQTLVAPNAKSVGTYALYGCSKLKSLVLPSVTSLTTNSFREASNLEVVDLPKLTAVPSTAFYGCRGLKALILRSETMVTLSNTNAFIQCYRLLGTKNSGYNPTGEKIGFIYVPAALIDQYGADTTWTSTGIIFRALEGYTVDGTITGELDESKI